MADVNSARVANTASTSAYLFPRSWCMRSSLSTSSALKGVAWVTMVAAINTSPGGVASVSQLAITPGDGPQPRSGLRTLANSSVLRPRRSRADATWARASAAMSGRYPERLPRSTTLSSRESIGSSACGGRPAVTQAGVVRALEVRHRIPQPAIEVDDRGAQGIDLRLKLGAELEHLEAALSRTGTTRRHQR